MNRRQLIRGVLAGFVGISGFSAGYLRGVSALGAEIDPQADRPAASLMVVNVDGSDSRDISNREMSYFGSPRWSHDGRRLVYDAWKGNSQNYNQSHIFICNADGTNVVDLGFGALPSWSTDDSQVVGQSYAPAAGIYVMSTDGRQRRQLTVGNGSPRWSPVENAVGYLVWGTNFSQLQVETGDTRQLLEDGWRPYWGFDWSPDGRRLAFARLSEEGGSVPNQLAIARLDPEEPTGDVTIRARAGEVFTTVAWSPDGKHVLFAMRKDARDNFQLYTIAADDEAEPVRIPWQDPERHNVSGCWSPDGKHLAYITQDKL